MNTTATKWAAKAAGTGALALLLAAPALAQSRGDWSRNNQSNRGAQAGQVRAGDHQFNSNDNYRQNQNDNYRQNQNNNYRQNQNNSYRESQSNGYRENQRINASGRITSFSRERGGYRVGLDRGGSYWVPESRGRGLRVGLSINLGGIFRGGSVFVDSVGYPGGYAYDNAYLRGFVDSVNYRTGTVWLRDEASGRMIPAAVGGGYALSTLHRGELVELTGQWAPNGVFGVASIANLRY